MELDDLKNTWDAAAGPAQQQLTGRIIDRVTQKKYNSKIKKIAYPEILGSIICLLAAVYTGMNFYKLDTAFLKGTGILCILLLLALTAISFASIRSLSVTNDINKPYAATLLHFARQKQRFYKLQQANISLSYLLLVTVIILFAKFFEGTDITGSKYFWTFSFSLGYLFLLFFSRYVTRFYKRTVQQTEELLQETEP